MEKISIPAELKAHFLRLYQIALSDENFSHIEMQLLYKFAEERSISRIELDEILIGSTGKILIPDTLEKRIEYLYDLAKMIWADGVITEDEKVALKKYIRKFEFLEKNVEELASYLLKSAQVNKPKEKILQELKE